MDHRFRDKAARIQMLLMDVDGVLTDGTFEPRGTDEGKRFHSRDGIGMVLARRAGLKLGVISGRASTIVERRARELQMSFVRLGVSDKLACLQEALHQESLSLDKVAYVGDDLPDLPILVRVGLSAAVADAHHEIRSRVDFVTRARGGHGAIRELVDELLTARGVLEGLVEEYLTEGAEAGTEPA